MAEKRKYESLKIEKNGKKFGIKMKNLNQKTI